MHLLNTPVLNFPNTYTHFVHRSRDFYLLFTVVVSPSNVTVLRVYHKISTLRHNYREKHFYYSVHILRTSPVHLTTWLFQFYSHNRPCSSQM